jgi:hypothetical protein
MTESFWKDALASLPPAVRRRYAAHFEMAERLEWSLDRALDAWASVKRALARICCAGAYAMHVAAPMLERAAQRLLLTH